MSFEGIAKSRGAVAFYDFDQSIITPNLNFVLGRQVEFPRGYVRIESDNVTTNGCCFGLCMTLMNGDFDFRRLEPLLKTNEGIGQVRGYQFIQKVGVALDVLLRNCLPDYDVPKYGKAGKSFLKFKSYVKWKKSCCFYIKVYCNEDLTHAICMQREGERYSIFDPNVGFWTFNGAKVKEILGCLDDLTNYMDYGGVGKFRRFILRITKKKDI
ncbi:hypothetical protein [Parashewanella tropica]|uniref:hypothetical protein n=1 Tax=Parashewanella tropica TaxID=2547970 RepID=UPI00105A1F9A|nr:hypothetical protein [Parashewanella tropica]